MQKSTGRPVAKAEEQSGSTILMPSFARRPSTMNSFFPAEGPQNSMADQQRLHFFGASFCQIPTPSMFSCWKIKIQNPRKYLFRFSLGGRVMDQRSGDGGVG